MNSRRSNNNQIEGNGGRGGKGRQRKWNEKTSTEMEIDSGIRGIFPSFSHKFAIFFRAFRH